MKIHSSSGVNMTKISKLVNNTDDKYFHSFEMQLEHIYVAQIQPTRDTNICAEPVKVIGKCSGKYQEPGMNEQTNITNIIIPVIVGIVLLSFSAGLAVYKYKKRTQQPTHKNTILATDETNSTANYATVGDGEITAAYSNIDNQPAVYVNYQQNSSYETVKIN